MLLLSKEDRERAMELKEEVAAEIKDHPNWCRVDCPNFEPKMYADLRRFLPKGQVQGDPNLCHSVRGLVDSAMDISLIEKRRVEREIQDHSDWCSSKCRKFDPETYRKSRLFYGISQEETQRVYAYCHKP